MYDNQERINRDALKEAGEYWECVGLYYCDKCPHFDQDFKTPQERYGVNSCRQAQVLDLLRRQRELLINEAKQSLPYNSVCTKRDASVNWRYLVEERLDDFIEEHKEEIFDVAADKLVEAYKRTKAFKEKMGSALDDAL